MFPVGLGLKIVFVSSIFIVLIFGLCLPVLAYLKHKKRWSYLFFFFGIITFFIAHFNSDFKPDTPKPNSLVYALNADENNAVWATYDTTLDQFTKNFLGNEPETAATLNQNTFGSKYGSGFTYLKSAPIKAIPKAKIEISNDTVIENTRHFTVCVMPQRNVQRIEVFADSTNLFKSFTVNGIKAYRGGNDSLVFKNRWRNRLFSYSVCDDEPLEMQISIPKNQKTNLQLFEASFDLLDNELFSIPPRERNMIPKPFVLNDAIVVKKTIIIN